MPQENPFRRFLAAGYTRLVSITPPGCDVYEKSTLANRRKDLGKAPGVRRSDGTWQGYDFLRFEPTDAHYDAWAAAGAGVGIRTGDGLIAIDIDTLDADKAHICASTATEVLGASENRVGRAPKRLKLYRTSEPVPYQRLRFQDGHVEVLSDGRQFVAHGIHPATGEPYTWPRGLTRYEALPVVSAAKVAEYMAKLAGRLPEAKVEASTLPTERQHVDPVQLTGREADVRRAVAALPNTSELFPTYDSYIEVAQAIKGALPDDPETGLELFQDWASRWTDGHNDAERVAADWKRCKASHSLGASYLYNLAAAHGAGDFSQAETWFQAQPAGASVELNPFELQERAEAEKTPEIEPIRWVRPSEWVGDPPPRLWEVKDWIPKGEVVLLYGEGGVGKTLLAHQYAICAATGTSWLGQQTRQARVMCFFCEDSEDELHRRHVDISRALGVTPGSSDGRLRIASRKYEDNLLALWDRNSGAMRRTAVWEQLRGDAAGFGANVLIVDTLADTFGGSEIDRGQVNAFVKSCLGRLAAEIGCTVIALGHPSVGGRAEGRSGSTAWANAARSRIYLQYPKGAENGNVRDLATTKTNYGPQGGRIKLRWERGAFTALRADMPGVDLNAFNGDGGLPTIAAGAEAAVRTAWAALDNVELAGSKAVGALRGAMPDALAMFSDDELTAALQRMRLRGEVIEGEKKRLCLVVRGALD